jgi:dTMP kinase
MFIAFEGLDGSGSSTHSDLLTKRLQDDGYKVALTKEPTNNLVGGLIRGILSHQWTATPETLQLLFSADRGHHLNSEIEPWLNDDKIVITDRYMMSTFAFGSLSIEDEDWLKTLNSKFRKPDLTILLKVAPEECMNRISKGRAKTELFEKEDKLRKVWKRYEELSNELENVIIIDANRAKEEVHEEIYREVIKRLS